MKLVPWLLGHGAWCEAMVQRCPLPGCEMFDVLASSSIPFFQLVNAGNALAYRGSAMPAWVQLDCACLPGGMVGLGVPRAHVEEEIWRGLVENIEQTFGTEAARGAQAWTGIVPLSEYGCVPTPEPRHVVGFSLFSLRKGLGVRTKALALLMHAARTQVGVAQVNNSALRTHTAMGPLHVVAPIVRAHSLPRTTFAYRLALPSEEALARLALGDRPPPRAAGTVRLAIDEETTSRLAQLVEREGAHAIVDVESGSLVLSPSEEIFRDDGRVRRT